jgi:hypothetical protein
MKVVAWNLKNCPEVKGSTERRRALPSPNRRPRRHAAASGKQKAWSPLSMPGAFECVLSILHFSVYAIDTRRDHRRRVPA